MFLSKITGQRFKDQQPNDKDYETHQLMWTLFSFEPPESDREFLYFLFNGEIFMVSKKAPLLLPEHDFQIQTKSYGYDLPNGSILKFDIRLNPQVCRDNKKISVMTAYANDLREEERPYTLNHVAEESSKRWFSKRIEDLGFTVLDFRVVSFCHHRFKRSDGELVVYNTIDLNGALQVNHKGLFCKSLFEGIGRARAFGCGMMLVAPFTGV